MQVSVVVPVYNVLPLLKDCLASVFAAGSQLTFELIVVDNGSSPDVEEWLLSQEQLHGNLRHLRYLEPLGFARAVNAGAAVASGEIIVILNSDTIVTPGWMDGLYAALREDPRLGALTPYTNKAGDLVQMDIRTIDQPASRALAILAAQPNPRRVRYVPQRITFFCLAVRAGVWRELKGLDEAYRVGNYEDDHFCLRLRAAGFQLGVAEHLFVYHRNNATFRANRIDHGKWMNQNAALFASHARNLSERSNPAAPRWPKQPAPDISVVILPRPGAPLDRTLASLANQTLCDFEVLLPDAGRPPAGEWIAYIREGDILYPYFLESQRELLQRNERSAIFSNGWARDGSEVFVHPDADRVRPYTGAPLPGRSWSQAPRMPAGWMHHRSLDPARLWDQTDPLHWPHLTWETFERPKADRSSAGSNPPVALNGDGHSAHALQQVLDRLSATLASQTDAGKFRAETSLPDVILFNIIPWKALVQRPHHFARGLAERGHRVFWIETGLRSDGNWWTGRAFEQVCPGVHLVQLPGPMEPNGRCDVYHLDWDAVVLDAMSAALAQIASAYGVRQAVSLVHFPRWEPLAMRAREQFGWKIVYDCLDDQRAFSDLFHLQLRDHEDRLIEGADGLITSSTVLQRRLLAQRSSILLHNAADYDLFSSGTCGDYLRHLRRPVVGFFGALANWLDIDLIAEAAARFPDWSFVYIGLNSFSGDDARARWIQSTAAPNTTVLPQMDPCTLAMYLAEFDVCTMPFLDAPVTQTMNAVKIYEYLAAGKPVVSRDLPEIRFLLADAPEANDLIRLYSTREEFFAQLQTAVAGEAPDLPRRRQQFARGHDWARRVDVLAQEILRVAEPAGVYETSSIKASSSG